MLEEASTQNTREKHPFLITQEAALSVFKLGERPAQRGHGSPTPGSGRVFILP